MVKNFIDYVAMQCMATPDASTGHINKMYDYYCYYEEHTENITLSTIYAKRGDFRMKFH